MELGRVKGASLFTKLSNAERIGNFILRCLGQLGQPIQMGLFGRDVTQTRMRSARVVPVKVFGNVGADAVVGLQVHPLVFHAAPYAFDEHIVAPCAAPVVSIFSERLTKSAPTLSSCSDIARVSLTERDILLRE